MKIPIHRFFLYLLRYSIVHRQQKFFIRRSTLHTVSHKFHCLYRIHIGQVSTQYPHTVECVFSVTTNRPRRVLDAVMSTAGKMRLLDNFRSSCNSILPVPLNSSKITSSIFEPVSVKAVAIIVRLPPFSILRAAPKKRLGLCNALASTPPESTLPEAEEEPYYKLSPNE